MSIDDKINEALGITPKKPATKQVVKKEFTPPVPRLEDKNKEDLENDHKYSRENYYNLIERGQDAIQGILDIAQESQHPRACLLYTSPSPRDLSTSRMPSSA